MNLWPNGRPRSFVGGGRSKGVRELIVAMLCEDPNTPALDVYQELCANKVKVSYDYVNNTRSLFRTMLVELQYRGMLNKVLVRE